MADDKGTTSGKTAAKRKQKPIYAVLQILDKDGNAVAFPKEQIKVLGGFRSADGVLDMIESGNYPHATYKRIPLD